MIDSQALVARFPALAELGTRLGCKVVVVPGRLALMASQVSDAFGTKTRVNAADVWTDALLPSKAELNILPPAKK